MELLSEFMKDRYYYITEKNQHGGITSIIDVLKVLCSSGRENGREESMQNLD